MPTVLLVDDSLVALHALAGRLGAAGFDVRREATAAGARTAAAEALCCAVLDVELADGDGVELATELLERCASLPIAFFTAGAASTLLARARELGPVFGKADAGALDAVMAWVERTAQPPPTK